MEVALRIGACLKAGIRKSVPKFSPTYRTASLSDTPPLVPTRSRSSVTRRAEITGAASALFKANDADFFQFLERTGDIIPTD